MIEQIILDHLRENGFPCYMSVPEQASGNFCVLEKTGSGGSDGIYTATLAIQSYGPASTDHDGTLDAAKLNEAVKPVMLAADRLPEVVSCTLNTDYNFPDTTRKWPRYQAIFDVVHY